MDREVTEDGKKEPDATAEGSRAGGAPAPAAGREGRKRSDRRNGDADGLQPRKAGRADGVKLGHGDVMYSWAAAKCCTALRRQSLV